jgi:signal transduction histidine kinase
MHPAGARGVCATRANPSAPRASRDGQRGKAGRSRRNSAAAWNAANFTCSRWHLLVRRHDGSVDAMVAGARRRNLAVSFGIVLILGITTFVLAALLRRAERLRRQQNEFIAAISHELNTPVAALRSAGENLRDGIIHDREKLARYGGTIVRESTRLGDLTAQVLELAGMQERRARPAMQVDVAAVIDDAVAQMPVAGREDAGADRDACR